MPPVPEHRPVDRRRFLRTAATGAALSLAPSSKAATPASERLGIGIIGCGGRGQAHLNLLLKLAQETGSVAITAVCDVWDGHEEDYDQPTSGGPVRRHYRQGLYPSARAAGLDPTDPGRVVKDYRHLLDRKDVDAVVIATPDHWHGRMALDALAAGKDVLVETPMTRTPAEAVAVMDAAARTSRVVAVAAQGLADPGWRMAREQIRAGKLGAVAHLSAGVYRSDPRGYWRFYRTIPQMNPATVAWDQFLGSRFDVAGEPLGPGIRDCPFEATTLTQWRCDRRFSAGPFSDLYVHPVMRLLATAELGFPSRVIGAGGLYVEQDGRDVPDVATLAADFDSGCHLVVTGSTVAIGTQPEVIRGRRGTITLDRSTVTLTASDRKDDVIAVVPPRNETAALWANFIDCVKRRDRAGVLATPELGAAAVVVVDHARRSYETGRAWHWDGERRASQGQTN